MLLRTLPTTLLPVPIIDQVYDLREHIKYGAELLVYRKFMVCVRRLQGEAAQKELKVFEM